MIEVKAQILICDYLTRLQRIFRYCLDMNFEAILENAGLSHCVKQVWVLEGKEDATSTIPFYADAFM